MSDDTSVRVAVRIRPQNPRELIEMCHVCTTVTPNEPQVWLGKDKAFTFDHVFDINSTQHQVYETCVAPLIEGCFEGYNATVLAYGQTGSGKTYTMGTGFDISLSVDELGIIPRAVEHLFDGIEKRRKEAMEKGNPPPEFKINAQFMELYNEEIIDLLDPAREAEERAKRSQIKIHEDANGGIYTVGIATRALTSVEETIQCLKIGALSRTTASTQMNAQSSRSHAIFTLHIKQQRVVTFDSLSDENDENENGEEANKELGELETLTAKFHFVDLAGSERLKRTGATGERAKEGISINCGLLALGNVISALGDRSRRVSHVPYRDSKLTRLLQDSLGGNSRTLMIACVSPSDRDFMETLNTLKYANRAKNIKNKVTINQDKSSQTIAALRREIQMLQLELMEYKQGKRIIGEDGTEQVNDMFHENTMLQTENNNLRTRIKALQETIERLTARNCELLADKASGAWITSSGEGGIQPDISEMIQGYIKEIEELRTKLMESEELCSQLRKQVQRTQARLSLSPTSAMAVSISGHYDIGPYDETTSVQSVLDEARKDVKRLKKRTRKKSREEKDGEGIEEGDSKKVEEAEPEDITENGEENYDYESSDSDLEDEDGNKENYSQDLAELTSEISIKQKLIEELELSQRRLQMMRQHYEQKLIQLHNKIKETELERDRVLSSIAGNAENTSTDKVKKVKEEFEKKLSALQSELKKMQTAKREHAQMMKNQAQYEKQLRQLKAEVMDMKKAKVRLMNKMKEEAQKHREAEQRRNREIAQLKKESRKRENQIRTLEADKRLKETVLKRKQEEVTALRRMARPMSDRVAGRVPGRRGIPRSLPFSPKVAKHKWQTLEKNINKLVLNKQSINTVERDMERWLLEREKVGHYLKKVMKKKERAIQENKDESIIRDLDNEIEDLTSYIEYIHENITECQTNIMQMEEAKEDTDPADITNFVTSLQEAELKYLLEKLVNMAINQSLQAAQKEANLRETEVKMKQIMESNVLQQQLLEHIYDKNHANVGPIAMGADKETDSISSSRSTSPVDTSSASLPPTQPALNENIVRKDKARKRTATPHELLFASSEFKPTSMSSLPETFDGILGQDRGDSAPCDRMTQSLVVPSDQELPEFGLPSMPRVPSAPGSLKEMAGKPRGDVSPMFRRKTYDKLNRVVADGTSSLRRKIVIPGARSPTVISRQNSLENSESTPPNSPPVNRRNRGDNVFSRLTSGTSVSSHRKPDRGIIAPFTGKPPYAKNSPLVCTHVAEGHSQAVLCVAATDDVLFSGSKDRTVKIWDLQTGKEIQSFGNHPNNVKRVVYNEYTRLAFSVSMAYIKIWDSRENPAKCVRTLSSSGNAVHMNAPLLANATSRAHQLPPGESQINDVALTRYGTTLFSAAGNIVRIWDLRTFQSVGRLSGGHQAAVMCMAVDELGFDGNLVITGSKDHYIKVFEVMERVGGLHVPKVNLEPPHYDGIESLAITGEYLFSGSRDMCIKKWDLSNQTLVQSINQAHKDWICAIAVLPGGNALLSGCRGGFLKLWATDTCQMLGEMRAHNANINAITLNSSVIFTASNDNTVALWRLRSSSDASPDYSDFGDEKAF